MAFLVCYSKSQVVDWGQKAIYLEQSFYEQLFAISSGTVEFPMLGVIISLTYDDEVVIEGDQLEELQSELRKVLTLPGCNHDQMLALINIVRHAQENGIGLAIAGDMYPVLRRQ